MNTTHTTPAPAAHTPLTWRTVLTTAKGAGSARLDIVSDGAAYSPFFIAGDILPEDAELIARAVNNYADLLAALENAKKQFDSIAAGLALKHTVSISSVQNCAAQARAAISRAKGVQS